jgi:flagellar basal body-associated protein FliL
MSGEIIVFLIVAVVVVALALGVWLLDAKRNEEVEHDEERLDPGPSTDQTDPVRAAAEQRPQRGRRRGDRPLRR